MNMSLAVAELLKSLVQQLADACRGACQSGDASGVCVLIDSVSVRMSQCDFAGHDLNQS